MIGSIVVLFSVTIGLTFISGVESSTICKCSHSKFCRTQTGNYHFAVAPPEVICKYGTVYCCKGPGSITDVGSGAGGPAIATNDGRCTCVPQTLCGSTSGNRIETSPFGCGFGKVYCCKPPVSTSSTLPPPAQTDRCACKSVSSCEKVLGQHLEKSPWGTHCPKEGDGYCCNTETANTALSPYANPDSGSGSGSGCRCMTQASCFTARGTISPFKIGCPDAGVHCCGVPIQDDTDVGTFGASGGSGCICMARSTCLTSRGTISPLRIGCPNAGVYCCGVVSGDDEAVASAGEDEVNGGSGCTCMSRSTCLTSSGMISPLKIGCPNAGVYCCGVGSGSDDAAVADAGEDEVGSSSDCACTPQPDCSSQGGSISPLKIGCPEGAVYCCGISSGNIALDDGSAGRSPCQCAARDFCNTRDGKFNIATAPPGLECPSDVIYCCEISLSTSKFYGTSKKDC